MLLLAGLIINAACGSGEDAGAEQAMAEHVGEAEATPSGDFVPAEQEEVATPEEGGGPAEELVAMMNFEETNGYAIYHHYCAICHGDSGDGQGFNAFNLDPKPRSHIDEFASESLSDEELTRSITLGGAGRGKSPLMPAWGRTLSSRQIRYAVSYIRLLQRRAQAGNAVSEVQ